MVTQDEFTVQATLSILLSLPMSFARRSLAALAGLFLLQLTLLGSGTLCAMRHVDAPSDARAHAMHDMGGMSAASPQRTGAISASDASGSPVDCGGPAQGNGCRLPWAPGQCSSMTTCGMSATLGASIVVATTPAIAAPALSSPAGMKSGPTFAPELPPPRA